MNGCICQQKCICYPLADSTVVQMDSISYYVIRLSIEQSYDNQNLSYLTLDKDYYYEGKLKVAESRENIYVKDDEDKDCMLELYRAYYTILCNNPILSFENLCIPTTAHGVFYQEFQ